MYIVVSGNVILGTAVSMQMSEMLNKFQPGYAAFRAAVEDKVELAEANLRLATHLRSLSGLMVTLTESALGFRRRIEEAPIAQAT